MGDRLSLSFDYIDLDVSIDTAISSAYSWRNHASMLTQAINPSTGDTESVDWWGDLKFGEDLDSVLFRLGKSMPSCDSRVAWYPQSRYSTKFAAQKPVCRYYSIDGRRIAGPASNAHKILISWDKTSRTLRPVVK